MTLKLFSKLLYSLNWILVEFGVGGWEVKSNGWEEKRNKYLLSTSQSKLLSELRSPAKEMAS